MIAPSLPYGPSMISSSHPEGSDAWYNDLEAWMRSQGIAVTDENIFIECERIGRFIPADMRFVHALDRAELEASRKAS